MFIFVVYTTNIPQRGIQNSIFLASRGVSVEDKHGAVAFDFTWRSFLA